MAAGSPGAKSRYRRKALESASHQLIWRDGEGIWVTARRMGLSLTTPMRTEQLLDNV
ncbi:MAG: hypothetical protein ACLTSZ_17185 [Lachnospiraceae bacterium]